MSQPSHAGVTGRPPHLSGVYVGSEDQTLIMRLSWHILSLPTVSSDLFVCLFVYTAVHQGQTCLRRGLVRSITVLSGYLESALRRIQNKNFLKNGEGDQKSWDR